MKAIGNFSTFSSLQEVGISAYSVDYYLFGFLDRAEELATGSILMSASIEETSCHFIARKVIDTSEAKPYSIGFLAVFAQRDGESVPLHLQWHIDKSLSIAFDVIEAFLLFLCNNVI